MPKFSILMRIAPEDQLKLAQLQPSLQVSVSSLVQQSFGDWELYLLGTQDELSQLDLPFDSRLKTVITEPGELREWVANRLLPQLGEWIGFMNQGDQLLPGALTALGQAIDAQPTTRVAYTDEQSRNWFGQISMRFRKGAINPLRLRSQEYLRDFCVVRHDTLEELGGFSLITSTVPVHDVYLQVLESYGISAFCHLPEQIYQRYRDHRGPVPEVHHDLQAIKEHLLREQVPARVRQLNGDAVIEYLHQDHPWVTAVIIVGDEFETGRRRILRSQVGTVYRPSTFKVLHLGEDQTIGRQYQELCSTLRMEYGRTSQSKPVALNQEALACETPLILFLEGEAVHPRWLHRLIDHVRIPGTGAVGPKCFAGSRLHQPGVLGHHYEGWDWNTAGRFDVMTVPHQTAAVSPACLLIDVRLFHQFQFKAEYPELYGMDLCLRLDAAGKNNLMVPTSRVEVTETLVPQAEADQFRLEWSGWVDRFGLHMPLQQ